MSLANEHMLLHSQSTSGSWSTGRITSTGKVRPTEIEYLEIRVHNPYHENLIELNPRMSGLFQISLENV